MPQLFSFPVQRDFVSLGKLGSKGALVFFLFFQITSAAPAAAAKNPSPCSAIFSYSYGKEWNLPIPKHLIPVVQKIRRNPPAAIAHLNKMGYRADIAARMVENAEWAVPFLIAGVPFSRPRGTVNDRIRYPRSWTLKDARTAGGHEPIVVYRGIAIREKGQKVDLSPKVFFQSEFKDVGNVAWVTPSKQEAGHYARFASELGPGPSGYVLKFQIPADLFYQSEEFGEGFIHPRTIGDFRSYLIGAYEIGPGKLSIFPGWDGNWEQRVNYPKPKWLESKKLIRIWSE